MNPLLNAGMAKNMIFGAADSLRLARNDTDASAYFELLQANATLPLRHAHLLCGNEGGHRTRRSDTAQL